MLTTVSDAPFNRTGDGPTINALTGGTMGADHPVTWCKDYKGGRSYYTNHGASAAAWNDANLAKELLGAIKWAAGDSDPVYSDCGATVRANYQQSFVAAPPNLSEPIGFDVLPDGTGRVIQTDRRGGVRLHDPATNSTTLSRRSRSTPPTRTGCTARRSTTTSTPNKWVYLFYSPPTVEDVRLADGSIVTQTTPLNDPATPAERAERAEHRGALSAWDPYVGYFQLSRFKFVEASGGNPAHLDLASEQQILRVPNNRGACCHVAGDIDFDSHNNLWLVTGDDTPSGGGNSGGFAPFNGQLTNESQTIAVANATGGTFTLTFDGQTTAPIPFPLDNADIEAALEALSNIDDVAVTGTGTRTVNFRGNKAELNVPLMTGDASGLTGTTPTLTVAMATVNNGQGTNIPADGGLFNAPHVDARRSAQNTNDLRGKVLRITVKSGDITRPRRTTSAGPTPSRPGTSTRSAPPARGPRSTRWASATRSASRSTRTTSPTSVTTRPTRRCRSSSAGPSGTGRFEIVRAPANYGWPLCYKTDLPYYQWDFNTSLPLPSVAAPETHDCDDPARGPQNTSRWVANGGPTVDPGLEYGPPITNPEIWYSYRDNQAAPNGPQGTPVLRELRTRRAAEPGRRLPAALPGALHGRRRTARHRAVRLRPGQPEPDEVPALLGRGLDRRRVHPGHAPRGPDGLEQRDPQDQQHAAVRPRAGDADRPWLCDNPMDMEFGPDGTFYLLTYGDGFFAINPDAGMMRWEYVKGLRAPVAVLSATPTDGPAPLTVAFSSAGSNDADPGDSIRFEWDFDGNGTVDSVEPNPTHTYTTAGQFTAKLSVIDSSGKIGSANTTITVGNTAPVVTITVPVEGGTFAFGEDIPFIVTVTDPEDGAIDCADVQVTFVLGHDTHGHAEASTTGCSGVLPTDADDVSHGGNVFGVISASYTDGGGPGGVPALTTVAQNQIRQKRQEVEFAVNQSGTNIGGTTDVGGGLQRGGLSAGDWIQLNGPFNLLNIDAITFRTSGGNAGSPAAGRDPPRHRRRPDRDHRDILGTANATTYASQTFPIADTGTHEYFLVFHAVPAGPGNNFFNLNWIEFGGAGVSTP